MNTFLDKYVRPYVKAHLGGFGSAFGLMLADAHGNLGALGSLTGTQWTEVAVMALGIGGLVASFANKPFVAPAAPVFPSQDVAPDASA